MIIRVLTATRIAETSINSINYYFMSWRVQYGEMKNNCTFDRIFPVPVFQSPDHVQTTSLQRHLSETSVNSAPTCYQKLQDVMHCYHSKQILLINSEFVKQIMKVFREPIYNNNYLISTRICYLGNHL